jgi:hypothetical protein
VAKIKHEISTDGKTVWVDGPFCLARFGRLVQEYLYDVHFKETMGFESKIHVDGSPTQKDWDTFVKVVRDRFKIKVSKKYRPSYVLLQKKKSSDTVVSG